MFQCPLCHTDITIEQSVARCRENHSFDISKNGYINFLLKNQKRIHGDHPSMINARRSFLIAGHYKPLFEAINHQIQLIQPKNMLDAGCGEGYYTNLFKFNNRNLDIYAFDISKDAIIKAAKTNTSTQYFVSSVNQIPIKTDSIQLITSLFAPINIEEFSRILSKNGVLVMVRPLPYHLYELKELIYKEVKMSVFSTPIDSYHFRLIAQHEIRFTMTLHQPDLSNCFYMTPFAFRTTKQDKDKLELINSVVTKAEFELLIYQKI